MIREYAHEPLMWDTLARRELQGLAQPVSDTAMELENADQKSLRARITSCIEVYQTAIKKIKTAEIWSLYIECLLEINRNMRSLPNLKRKLLKTAFTQAHRVKKLKEEHYLHWVCIQYFHNIHSIHNLIIINNTCLNLITIHISKLKKNSFYTFILRMST